MSNESLYDLFGISEDASFEEIRAAYFQLAKAFHPDTNSSQYAKEIFLKIQEGYLILNDPLNRKNYDLSIKGKQKVAPKVEVLTRYSSTIIQSIEESQLFHVLLQLKNTHNVERKDTKGFFCFVIDSSTSMKGAHIAMVKENLIRLIENLRPEDTLAIISFNDKVQIILTPTKVSDLTNVSEKINHIECFGGTEIYKGLKAAADLLWGNYLSNIIKHIYLITDGHTYGDEELCFQLAKKLYTNSIQLNTMGIGYEWNDQFLDKLAVTTGGYSAFISSSNHLFENFKKISETLIVIALKNVTLDISMGQMVNLNSIYRLKPTISELIIERPIPLGDLYVNQDSTFLLTFSIKPQNGKTKEVNICRGKVRYELVSPNNEKENISISILLPVQIQTSFEEPPREIIEALAGINVYQMQEKTNADVERGNINEAVKRLGNISTTLLRMGNSKLAKKAQKEAEFLKNNNRYSVEGKKQLKYGTRALISPEVGKNIA